MELGQATRASVIDLKQDALEEDAHLPVEVKTVTEEDGLGSRSTRLEEILETRPAEQGLLRELLREYHDAFSLEPHEREKLALSSLRSRRVMLHQGSNLHGGCHSKLGGR